MSFTLIKKPFHALPILHYNMECASEVVKAAKEIKPDCIVVELPENMQNELIKAASRLPDLSVVKASQKNGKPLFYLSEPCDGLFEALRFGLEHNIAVYCIDLDVDNYPFFKDPLPDPYAISKIGFKHYMEACYGNLPPSLRKTFPIDREREYYMARRLKELSFSYDRILFVGGLAHIKKVLELTDQKAFKKQEPVARETIEVFSLTEESQRELMSEFGYLSLNYEFWRDDYLSKESIKTAIPDRQKIYLSLLKQAGLRYKESTGNELPHYCLRNTLKFMRNYAHLKGKLLPDLFELLASAKGCVDHNYAYETWLLATTYPFLKNVDALPEIKLRVEDLFGGSKKIQFHRKLKNPKATQFIKRKKDAASFRFTPPNPFSICSYPPEDTVIENFGRFLKKKGVQILTEENLKVVPFSTSLEDGIDTKETIRHLFEKKLYVKKLGKPAGDVGSVVIIFDEDDEKDEKYPWKTTWIGEHSQESDMAFYATDLTQKVVGPGISRCEYGGFMMSYPPRRLWDVWHDPDYLDLLHKSEVLLMAAIDYSLKPTITYVAKKAPRSLLKSYAARFGKKVVFLPIGQVSRNLLNKIRVFHVLDGHDKRRIADEFIY